MSSTIICVDDDKFLVDTLVEQIRGWLGTSYTVEKSLSGPEALEILDDCISSSIQVPLIISDYIMPVMNGAELLTKVHERDKSIKKIMLTGYSALDGIVSAINNAALYRFVSKPWNNKDLMLTVQEALRSYEQEKRNQLLLQSFEKLYRGYEAQLDYLNSTFSGAIDIRCAEDFGHSKKVMKVANALGQKLGMNADDLKALRSMALFHDIGRLALSDADLQIMKSTEALIYDYPDLISRQNKGAEAMFKINPQMDAAFLKGIANHYEKFNGSGVRKLVGTNIPIEARIIGITNFYVVLTTDKNKQMKSASAISMIASLKNTIFDPNLVDVFSKLDLPDI